jgi:ferrous iron transport protein A
MQLSFKKAASLAPASVMDLREGQTGILRELDLPADLSRRLMELGFLPGIEITAGKAAPSGDPRVFRVDGSEIALRRETARFLILEPGSPLASDLP